METYQTGDTLFYPKLGPVRLVSREIRETERGCIHFTTWRGVDDPNGITHSIPSDNVDRVLRPLATKEEIAEVFQILQEDGGKPSSLNYTARIKYQREKLNTGNYLDMAELVRDLELRRGLARPKGLTDNEKRNLQHALRVLSLEVSVVLGISLAHAERKILSAVEALREKARAKQAAAA